MRRKHHQLMGSTGRLWRWWRHCCWCWLCSAGCGCWCDGRAQPAWPSRACRDPPHVRLHRRLGVSQAAVTNCQLVSLLLQTHHCSVKACQRVVGNADGTLCDRGHCCELPLQLGGGGPQPPALLDRAVAAVADCSRLPLSQQACSPLLAFLEGCVVCCLLGGCSVRPC